MEEVGKEYGVNVKDRMERILGLIGYERQRMTSVLALGTMTFNSLRELRKGHFLCFHQEKFSFKYTTRSTLPVTYITAGPMG